MCVSWWFSTWMKMMMTVFFFISAPESFTLGLLKWTFTKYCFQINNHLFLKWLTKTDSCITQTSQKMLFPPCVIYSVSEYACNYHGVWDLHLVLWDPQSSLHIQLKQRGSLFFFFFTCLILYLTTPPHQISSSTCYFHPVDLTYILSVVCWTSLLLVVVTLPMYMSNAGILPLTGTTCSS